MKKIRLLFKKAKVSLSAGFKKSKTVWKGFESRKTMRSLAISMAFMVMAHALLHVFIGSTFLLVAYGVSLVFVFINAMGLAWELRDSKVGLS